MNSTVIRISAASLCQSCIKGGKSRKEDALGEWRFNVLIQGVGSGMQLQDTFSLSSFVSNERMS